jgi:hypothetical protein
MITPYKKTEEEGVNPFEECFGCHCDHCPDYIEPYEDPCGGRSCDECEIGGCDHGNEC